MSQFWVLDWDGVVSRSMPPIWMSNALALVEDGRTFMKYDEWRTIAAASAHEFFRSQGYEGESLERIVKRTYVHYNRVVKKVPPQMYQDVPETLQFLAPQSLGFAVVSTHPKSAIEKEAGDYGIMSYFGTIIGESKNKATDIRDIYTHRNIDGTHVVFVSDSPDDITKGHEAGVVTVAACDGYIPKEKLVPSNPNHFIDTFADLKGLALTL